LPVTLATNPSVSCIEFDTAVHLSMPRSVNLIERRKQLMQLPLGHLTLYGPVFRHGKHQYIRARCSACRAKHRYVVNNLLRGRTTDCRCQRSVKYSRHPLAGVFGQRYDAIRQRFRNKAELPRRETFVRYMLELAAIAEPKIRTVKQLRTFRIQRLNDRRGFEKGNLSLVRPP
jgi:hypothetical protein